MIFLAMYLITSAILLTLYYKEKIKREELEAKLKNSYKDYNKIVDIVSSHGTRSNTEIVNELLFEINNLPF